MPDQNQSDPNSSTPTIDPVVPSTPVVPAVDTTVTTSTVQQPSSSTFFPTEDTPPVPAFQTVTTTTPETTTTTTVTSSPVQPTAVDDQSSGSAAPADFPPMTSSPKKKFGGGKVIATILGLFVLIGGVGAGIFLTQENQQFNQKADGGCPGHLSQDSCKDTCSQVDASGDSYKCSWDGNSCGKTNKLCNDNGNTGGGEQITAGNCTVDQSRAGGWFQCGSGTGPASCTFCLKADQRTCDQVLATRPECDNPTAGACGTSHVDEYQKTAGCIKYNGTGQGLIYSYECQGPGDYSGGCQKNEVIHRVTSGQSVCLDNKPASWCGAQQIDGGQGLQCFVSKITQCSQTTAPTNTPTPTPTGSISARCVNIKAYNTLWEETPVVQLKNLKAGDHINFCVTGTATSGSFDRARFTIGINGQPGVLQPDTTTHRPNTQDFCQNYIVPATARSFNITAEIHHVTLGWR